MLPAPSVAVTVNVCGPGVVVFRAVPGRTLPQVCRVEPPVSVQEKSTGTASPTSNVASSAGVVTVTAGSSASGASNFTEREEEDVCPAGLGSPLRPHTGVIPGGASGVRSGFTSVASACVEAAQPIMVCPVDGRYCADPMKKVKNPGGPYDDTNVAVPSAWFRW